MKSRDTKVFAVELNRLIAIHRSKVQARHGLNTKEVQLHLALITIGTDRRATKTITITMAKKVKTLK